MRKVHLYDTEKSKNSKVQCGRKAYHVNHTDSLMECTCKNCLLSFTNELYLKRLEYMYHVKTIDKTLANIHTKLLGMKLLSKKSLDTPQE
jgi:hypothetical protein